MEFNLEEILKKKKITKYELAKSTHLSYSTIHDLCTGKRNIDKLTLINALKILRYVFTEKELIDFIMKY